jgi:DNA-binding protein Fis
MLCEYHWRGNVRELENTIERAVVLARAPIVDVSDIDLHYRDLRHRPKTTVRTWTDQISLHAGWKANLAAIEKAMIVRALQETDGNKSKAADMLGIHRKAVVRKECASTAWIMRARSRTDQSLTIVIGSPHAGRQWPTPSAPKAKSHPRAAPVCCAAVGTWHVDRAPNASRQKNKRNAR